MNLVLCCIKITFWVFFLFSCSGEKQNKSPQKNLLKKCVENNEISIWENKGHPINQTNELCEIDGSTNDIYSVIRVLDSLLTCNNYEKLKYYGHALDDKHNQIMIMLGDTSKQNIEQFKMTVLDSPYLKFEKAEKFRFE